MALQHPSTLSAKICRPIPQGLPFNKFPLQTYYILMVMVEQIKHSWNIRGWQNYKILFLKDL